VLVICASPFLLVPQERSFSMVQTRYPSDGCLARSSPENIYGTADKHGHLANTTVLWAYASENIWASDRHKERVSRFWSMFIASQGPNAVLARFTSDTPQVLLDALRTDHQPAGEFAANPSDSAVVMHLATVRDIPVEVALPVPPIPPKPIAQPAPVLLPVPVTTPAAAPQPTTTPPATRPKVEQAKTQSPTPPPAVVTLDVRVADTAHRPVAGLAQADFTILEDGVQQDIASFTTERAPMSLVLLLDTSGSIASKLDKIRAAASTLIRQAAAQDEFCLVEFKSEVSVIQDFTSDPASADRALATLKAGGETALLDAVRFGLEYANNKGKNERKGILLITDGGENGSQSTRADVIPLLQQGNVQFYSIAFPEGLGPAQAPDSRGHGPVKAQPTEALARNLLDTLAKASSGGLLFYPRQTAELAHISESIVSDLRAPRYTLAYHPRRPQTEAGWRSIQVLVRPSAIHGPLTARTRAGYLAGQANANPGPLSTVAIPAQPSQ
jgi:Ca-activated chloride channel homolog